MRPTPIPNHLVTEGTKRQVMAAPNGDLMDDHISACEALTSNDETGARLVHIRLVLEPGELERLKNGHPVWLTMLGGLMPFDVQVEQ